MKAEEKQKAIQRMKELSGILKEASRAYYAEDREIISNLEYRIMGWFSSFFLKQSGI